MFSLNTSLPPPLLVDARIAHFSTPQSLPFSPVRERKSGISVLVRASGESTESSTSLSIVKSVQNVWERSEDRIGLIGLGFAGIVAVWASVNLITAIDKLPLIPGFFEFVGILFSSWFIYRYLLFKPDRQELLQIINKSVSDILGQ